MEAQTQLDFGQKLVGLKFNPSGLDAVNKSKQGYADLINEMNDLRTTSESPEVKRMCATAITTLQTAQMWATKAITWKD